MTKILIIENHNSWRKKVLEVIDIDQYNIDEAASLKEAREKLKAKSYDLLIVDLSLSKSEFTELSVFGQLISFISADGTQSYGRVPIIIVTGRIFSREEITDILVDFPGWIWGWHEKRRFDDNKFRENIEKVLKVQENYIQNIGKVFAERSNKTE